LHVRQPVLTLGAPLRVNLAFCWGNASICIRGQQLNWLRTHEIAIFVVHAMPARSDVFLQASEWNARRALVVGFQGRYKCFAI
jgi:hypothetical protein